jgi:predicted hydrolase (HD superfamily)
MNHWRVLLWEINDVDANQEIFTHEMVWAKIRTGARVLIQDSEWKIALSHNWKDDFYILPWWWVNAWESVKLAAHREVREEVWISIPESALKSIGLVIWHRTFIKPLCQKDYCYYTTIDTVGKEFRDMTHPEQKLITWRYTISEATELLQEQTQRFDIEWQRHFKMVANRELLMLQEANQLWHISFDSTSTKNSNTVSTSSSEAPTALVEKYLTDTKLHCQQVGFVMQQFAKQLWEDESLRHTVWLLHDIDRDHIGKVAENHLGEQFDTIMDEFGADEHLRRAIRSHYPDGTWVQPESLIEKYLISVDELTWFLYAYARMRPEWYNGIKRKSINKKIKDKQFASWVDRDHLKNCETFLWIPLAEFALSVVAACNTPNFPTV